MSLQIWLPLNKDLRNQGLNNVQVTNSGATIDNNGKIGKCYSIAPNSGLTLPATAMNSFTDKCSVTFWLYINSWNTAYDTIFQAGLGSTPWNNYVFGVLRNNGSSLVCTLSNGSSTTSGSYATSAMSIGSWMHLAFVYGNNKIKIYLNGVLDKEYTPSIVPKFSDITNISIGRCTNNSNYACNIKLNDFRIYNNVLEPAEIKKISQALVLHYPLNNNGYGNENLITGSLLNGSWAFPTSSYSDKYTPTTVSIPTGDTYTLSFDAKSTVEGDKIVTHYYSPNTTTKCITNQGWTGTGTDGYTLFTLSKEWRRYWVTYTQSSTTAVKHVICPRLNSANGTGTVSIKCVKFEQGSVPTTWCPANSEITDTNIEYDISGFQNNGQRINTMTYSSNTPRYKVSTHIGATNQKIHISDLPTAGFGNSYSFSWWGKRDNNGPMFWGFDNGVRLNGMYQGNLWNTGDGSNNPIYSPGTTTTITAPSLNDWHHYVMTGDGTTCKLYLDGVLYGQAKTYKNISGTSIWINGWNSATDYSSSNCDMSDFRIYGTVLNASDVAELYALGHK